MSVISSDGSIVQINKPLWPRNGYASRGWLSLNDGSTQDYSEIYKRQPAVRTVVDFLARNIAQLGIHTYRRVTDVDRQRLTSHPLAELMAKPNPYTTRYRMIRDTVSDLAIFDDAYWAKVRIEDAISVVRIPAYYVSPEGDNWLRPTEYVISGSNGETRLAADQIVHFRGFSADDPRTGTSPLETLRRLLAEEDAAGSYRENLWKNAARVEGVIERPIESPEWSDVARRRFREDWDATYAGTANSGKTVILEEGMQFKAISFSAKDSEYIAARKLTREEVARAYHIPLPMVGILDNATYSNITEQHKSLYMDTLGPWLSMIQEEIELQLLPEFQDQTGVYVEFNLAEKLRGSFEEQAAILSSAAGAPYLTRNEARARLNLPQIDDPSANELVTPLNVLIGGQASPVDATTDSALGSAAARIGETKATPAKLRTEERERMQYAKLHEQVLMKFFDRQRRVLGSKAREAKVLADGFDLDRWNRELSKDLEAVGTETVKASATKISPTYDVALASAYIKKSSEVGADYINRTTLDALRKAETLDEAWSGIDARIAAAAVTRATGLFNFGRNDGARSAGLRSKVWVVTSANSRHPEMDGETAPLGETFSNGAQWPGDPSLGVDEVAGCMCLLDFE